MDYKTINALFISYHANFTWCFSISIFFTPLSLIPAIALVTTTINYSTRLINAIPTNNLWNWNWEVTRILVYYRVSHSKPSNVILLWWGYRFWFLLIFWVLCVYELGTFILNLSIFIFLMLRALYFIFFLITQSYTPNHAATSIY